MNNKRGLIFQIIHGSFVDGYGVRTTVFLKGCPLRCRWCCNPEGQLEHREIKFTASACNGCGNCFEVCPENAIHPDENLEDTKIRIDRSTCSNCGKCIEVCYTGALDFFGKYMTVDEVFDIVIKDQQYYRSSGGGVTVGGGEPTFQTSFTHELLKKCKDNYIHVAIDTCGYTMNNDGLRVLEDADLLLHDLKGMDAKQHLRNTGFSNELILKNIKILDALGKPMIIRVPIIPKLTDTEQNIKSTAEFLCKLKSVERVDILPYHQYGTTKYAQLGREYALDISPPSQEQVSIVEDIFLRCGLDVQIGG